MRCYFSNKHYYWSYLGAGPYCTFLLRRMPAPPRVFSQKKKKKKKDMNIIIDNVKDTYCTVSNCLFFRIVFFLYEL